MPGRQRLTVVQLLPALESGGVERSTIEIAQALTEAGHRAVVVSAGGRLLPELQQAGARHVSLDIGRKSPLTFRHVPRLRRLLVELGADIVHARSRLPAWIGWRAVQRLPQGQRPRFMTTAHGLNSPSRYSAIMARGERVICVSETVRAHMLRHYPATDPTLLRVVPRGIDPAAFPRRPAPDLEARARASLEFPQLAGSGPLLLMPGRGTRLKGHADALSLLAALRSDGMDARLWMPGARAADRARYVQELERLARRLGVLEALAMTPPTAWIADAYAASDLVLQLSRKPEAFGRTVLEALSTGRPVLGWDHGGAGELVRELQPSGAVPAFNQELLADRARALLQQPPAPPAVIPYTLSAMQDATLAVYDELARR